MEIAWFFLLILPWMVNSLGGPKDINLHIIRQNNGDLFGPEDALRGGCQPETCVGLSSGTAQAASGSDLCTCQCHSHLPAFREDLRICVDDIHECVLAPFVGGSTSQQIPFVFLPLKGQIIHPSKEISFTGIQTPICAVSGAKFLTEKGWVDLRNPVDTDVPFRLFRDEGRTFLQWNGESDLRTRMSGRLVLVYLMCRELAAKETSTPTGHTLFSPCVAFRVVGTPSKYSNNVSEVAFSQDGHSSGDRMSVSEYIAIGICSILLGLIYVASVFLYLHLRKRNKDNHKTDQNIGNGEEGIIKNNPLLSMAAHFPPPDTLYSDSTNSDTEISQEMMQHHEERMKNNQITSALVHSHPQRRTSTFSSLPPLDSCHDSSSIEKLPEENVSIVETLEGREERPDSLRAITGTVRRKLYFNPAYFDPQLLLAPPPAALEFLAKIREVITIAKQKMASKRFSPSLMGIPEEEPNYITESTHEHKSIMSRRNSVVSLKRENSRRKNCSGCPGCEPSDFEQLCGRLPEFPSLAGCNNCTSSESKQRSIQKWLEDVPVKHIRGTQIDLEIPQKPPKRVRSPTRSLPSLPPDGRSTPVRALSPRPSSERGGNDTNSDGSRRRRRLHKPKAPAPPPPKPPPRTPTRTPPRTPVRTPPRTPTRTPPRTPTLSPHRLTIRTPPRTPTLSPQRTPMRTPPRTPEPKLEPKSLPHEDEDEEEPYYDQVPMKMAFPPPDMIHEAMALDTHDKDTNVPSLTKKQMNAVINQLSEQKLSRDVMRIKRIEYESDSLERFGRSKGYSTPTEYGELSSSQPSPSLSGALPMDEEMMMRNAIFNKNTGNMTISKINVDTLEDEDDHDYELIVLKKGSLKKYDFHRLPELLQRNKGYSLVSEVYVNNGYNYSSAPSSISGSNCSTLDNRSIKVRYEEVEEKPGKLLIEVEDCPDNYIPVEEPDNFEPDTLDRKPAKIRIHNKPKLQQEFIDSLERPPRQILLRSNGSFKREPARSNVVSDNTSNFNRVFGSLREIYEAKARAARQNSQQTEVPKVIKDEEGRILTLEERHSKRQRRMTISNGHAVPPDVIPPPPHDNSPIYERPKPPRKVVSDQLSLKPPLPPKNGNGRSASKRNMVAKSPPTGTPVINHINNKNHIIINSTIDKSPAIQIFQTKNNKNWTKPSNEVKPEDSGYLSTDSNDSPHIIGDKASESEGSLEDGHSESGAESIETHSVFFGTYRKPNPYMVYGSIDSGVDADNSGLMNRDSGPLSYIGTVIPHPTFDKRIIIEMPPPTGMV